MTGSTIQKKFIVSSGQTNGMGASKIGGMSVQQQQMLNQPPIVGQMMQFNI
jgi:hypothetical protein